MKILGLSVVAALGLVIGVLWTREAPPNEVTVSRPAIDQGAQPSQAHRPVVPRNAEAPPTLSNQERPTLEATAADPSRRKAQERLWQELRTFASEAKLTDVQWAQFQRDLSELAESESAGWANAIKTGDFDDVLELNAELGQDLETRCANYMTRRQLSVLRRYRADILVTQVRQLHFVPKLISMQAE